jgi:hypothetical protein
MPFTADDLTEPCAFHATRERRFRVRELGYVFVPITWANSTESSSIEQTIAEHLNMLESRDGADALAAQLKADLHLS